MTAKPAGGTSPAEAVGAEDTVDDVDHLGYADTMAELESILAAIEDDAVDIDQLSRQVRRAAALIRLCQGRIAGARLEVERVVADLRDGASDDGDDVADADRTTQTDDLDGSDATEDDHD